MKDSMVFVEVERLVRKYKKTIDVSDAFQIVSMKRNYFFRFTSDSKPILVTGDNALAIAARQEGIRVWDCVNEPSQSNYYRHNIRLDTDLRTSALRSLASACQP